MQNELVHAPSATTGIDRGALPGNLAARAIGPGDRHYDRVRHTYASAGTPALVVVAETTADVRETVRFAAERRVPLAVRSGGHGLSTNDGGIVLDLRRLRDIQVVDSTALSVRVEPGARWGEVARALDRHDMALSSGDFGDVGVGGLATGGGVGLLARRQGLTIDRVRAVDVVLADGTLVHADDRQHADLLWAMRGAGGGFGVVTAFEFQADPIGDVTSAEMVFEATDLAGLLRRWAALVEDSPRDLSSFFYVQAQPGAGGLLARATVVDASGDAHSGRAAVAPFADVAPIVAQRVSFVRYMALVESARSSHQAQAAGLTSRGGLLDHVTAESAQAMADLLTSGAAGLLQLRSVGGRINDVAPEATAYAHRSQNFSLVAATSRARAQQLDAAWHQGISRYTRGTYLNLESERHEAVLRRAFPSSTLAHLHDAKHRYDPAGLFHHSLPLPPRHRGPGAADAGCTAR